MKNDEKAKEIANFNFPVSDFKAGKYVGALEMAKWKDQCLEKRKKNFLKDYLILCHLIG